MGQVPVAGFVGLSANGCHRGRRGAIGDRRALIGHGRGKQPPPYPPASRVGSAHLHRFFHLLPRGGATEVARHGQKPGRQSTTTAPTAPTAPTTPTDTDRFIQRNRLPNIQNLADLSTPRHHRAATRQPQRVVIQTTNSTRTLSTSSRQTAQDVNTPGVRTIRWIDSLANRCRVNPSEWPNRPMGLSWFAGRHRKAYKNPKSMTDNKN